MKEYLGYPGDYLDGIECNLTYNGARRTGACGRALKKWRTEYDKRTMTVEEVEENFKEFCIGCWMDIALVEMRFPFRLMPNFQLNCCSCADSGYEENYSYEKNYSSYETIRYLKAFILLNIKEQNLKIEQVLRSTFPLSF